MKDAVVAWEEEEEEENRRQGSSPLFFRRRTPFFLLPSPAFLHLSHSRKHFFHPGQKKILSELEGRAAGMETYTLGSIPTALKALGAEWVMAGWAFSIQTGRAVLANGTWRDEHTSIFLHLSPSIHPDSLPWHSVASSIDRRYLGL